MLNFSDKMEDLLRQVRREIDDTEDWNALYGLADELSLLGNVADERLVDLSMEGGE